MKKLVIIAALAAGACGQASKAPEAPAAPQGLFEQAAAKSDSDASVMAWQIVSTRTDLDPPCVAVRNVEDKGVAPADVAPDSIYAAYIGARVFSVQCGEQRTTVRAQPRDRWLVVLRPGAMEAELANCADETNHDRCYGPIPLASAVPAEAPAEAAKTP